MAFDSKGLDEYVDVAQRIADFRAHYPDGSLQPLNPAAPFEIREVKGTGKNGQEFTATFIVYIAVAYRDRTDPRPGVGMAWEVFPGRTPYTLGSELMNAETSAWGRAIIAALASDSKRGVSSREEVRNRAAENGHDHGGPQFPVTDRDTRLIPGRPVTTLGRPAPGTGADMTDEIRSEERPGSAGPADLEAIKRAYVKLGFDPRTDALRMAHTSEQLTARNLAHGPHKGKTHKNLTWHEAKALRAELEGFKDAEGHPDRGALLARLQGITQAAEATAAQDAAEGSQEEVLSP